MDEDHGHIAVGGQARRRGHVRAVGVAHQRPRRPGGYGLHRRGRKIDHRPGKRLEPKPRNGHAADRIDLRGASARQDADIGMRADDRNLPGGAGQGQQIGLVLQQDHGLFRVGLGDGGVGGEVDRLFAHRVIDQPLGEHRAQDPPGHVVEPGLGDLSRLDRGLQGGGEIGLVIEHRPGLLVEPVQGGGGGAVGRAPVRHHIAPIVPVALEDLIEQPIVFAGKGAVDVVIGAHHRARIGVGDGDFEGQKVRHPRGDRIDPGVEHEAARLLIIERIMFDRGDDVVGLDAADLCPDQGSSQERVFAAIFEIAAVARVAHQIDPARQHDVEAGIARLGADHGPAAISELRIPGRRRGQARGQ